MGGEMPCGRGERRRRVLAPAALLSGAAEGRLLMGGEKIMSRRGIAAALVLRIADELFELLAIGHESVRPGIIPEIRVLLFVERPRVDETVPLGLQHFPQARSLAERG